MKQRVHIITLAVKDIQKSKAFYESLGWQSVVIENKEENIVAFDLFGATFTLYPKAMLEKDLGREIGNGVGAITLACNAPSRQEVDAVFKQVEAAGAEIIKAPEAVFWGGYSGYFADPDGHLWEVAHNPFARLGENDEFRWNGF